MRCLATCFEVSVVNLNEVSLAALQSSTPTPYASPPTIPEEHATALLMYEKDAAQVISSFPMDQWGEQMSV